MFPEITRGILKLFDDLNVFWRRESLNNEHYREIHDTYSMLESLVIGSLTRIKIQILFIQAHKWSGTVDAYGNEITYNNDRDYYYNCRVIHPLVCFQISNHKDFS